MSNLSNGSTPAFPVPGSPFHGFTKREYMALMILQGLASQTNKYLPSVVDAVRKADELLAKLSEPA